MNPLVSICIPTYNQTFLLKQNLDAIAEQTYRNIEIIISDDSSDDEVATLVRTYEKRLPIQYVRNTPPLGPPSNWNFVLRKANGDFVLLLHHDDKFAVKNALALFVEGIKDHDADFVFGRSESVDSLSGNKPLAASYFDIYYQIPYLMIRQNVFGPPSNLLFRRKSLAFYDERYKWVVDMECYTRLFEEGKKFTYIDRTLILTGRHEGQVTNECINNDNVLIYENVLYAIDHIKKIKSIQVFDFYWRLLRNTSVKDVQDIKRTGIEENQIPLFIKRIARFQRALPAWLLKSGVCSKLMMAGSYFAENISTINNRP